ncbi:DExH-box ATP-dependent RNA helicase DExH1, partial [Durusdinium trenchii]
MPWSSAAPRDGAATLQPAAMNYEVLADFVTKLADGTLQGADASWPTHGAILVFMPGAGEISRLINALARRSSAFKALPLHGALSGEQQRRCFETFQVRKVIVATNVAETSVTLPDVTIVIDTCRERRLTREHGHSSLAPALLERFCAKDSLQQRRGRAGRVQKGVCFRLVPRKAYDKLPEATAAEIEALPLETLVLQVRAAGYAPEAFLAKAPTPPEAWQVRQAELELRQIGALKQEEESGAPAELLTALGRHLVALPCDVRVGRLLVLGAFLGVASAACSIAGWLSVRSPMPKAWQPDQETLRDTLRAKALRGGGGKSDHCFWVAIMDAFMAAKSRKAFCNDLGLSLERMVEAELCRTQLLRGLRSLGFQRDADGNAGDWHIVRAAVVAGLYPQVVSVERPTPKFAESLAGAIQIESDAREVRYWLSEDGGRARAFLHPSSLLFKESSYSCPYIIFSEKTIQQQNNPEHPTKLVLTGCSEASVYALLLFGGHLTVDHQQVEVTVDGGRGGRFAGGSTTVVAMLQRLRQAIDALLLQKVHSPSSSISGAKAAQCVVTLLSTDGLGPETEK